MRNATLFILGQCVALRIKNRHVDEGAYSISCFSNDSDYYRAHVKGKRLKERRLLN